MKKIYMLLILLFASISAEACESTVSKIVSGDFESVSIEDCLPLGNEDDSDNDDDSEEDDSDDDEDDD